MLGLSRSETRTRSAAVLHGVRFAHWHDPRPDAAGRWHAGRAPGSPADGARARPRGWGSRHRPQQIRSRVTASAMPSTQPVIAARPASSTRAACMARHALTSISPIRPPFAKRPCVAGSKVAHHVHRNRLHWWVCHVSLFFSSRPDGLYLPTRLTPLARPPARSMRRVGDSVLHAVDDLHLLVGCSDHRGLWWSFDGGASLHLVEGAETASVIDIHTRLGSGRSAHSEPTRRRRHRTSRGTA